MEAGASVEVEVTVKDADGCVRYYGVKREEMQEAKGAVKVAERLARDALREAEHQPNRDRVRRG